MVVHSTMDQTCQRHVNYKRSAKWHVLYTEIEMWIIPEWAWYVYKINQVARAMKRGMEANSLYRHYVEIGMLSHLLYSSLGLQLGYKVIYIIFRSLSNIISLIWQTTAELYLLRFLIKLQHMQQKQTFMAGQDYMGTLLARKYTNSSQSIVGHNEQIFLKGSRLVL